jgi:hypothetical protein
VVVAVLGLRSLLSVVVIEAEGVELLMSFAVHADVLEMAKTEEKREAIKWLYARRVFLYGRDDFFVEGLALARQCKHVDARLLVSLFLDGAPATKEEAAAVFLAQQGYRLLTGQTSYLDFYMQRTKVPLNQLPGLIFPPEHQAQQKKAEGEGVAMDLSLKPSNQSMCVRSQRLHSHF